MKRYDPVPDQSDLQPQRRHCHTTTPMPLSPSLLLIVTATTMAAINSRHPLPFCLLPHDTTTFAPSSSSSSHHHLRSHPFTRTTTTTPPYHRIITDPQPHHHLHHQPKPTTTTIRQHAPASPCTPPRVAIVGAFGIHISRKGAFDGYITTTGELGLWQPTKVAFGCQISQQRVRLVDKTQQGRVGL
ncbi:hypothetical protein Tco_0051746 [Tanacetum coccineum]